MTVVGDMRGQVEEFLAREALALDQWRLDDWLAMFDGDATFEVPCTDDPSGTAGSSQLLVGDDYARIVARVKRLRSRNAHAENPRSVTRRFITNILVEADGDMVGVQASFLIYRIRDGHCDPYIGRYEHVLRSHGNCLRFYRRRAIIETELLSPGGRLSFIL